MSVQVLVTPQKLEYIKKKLAETKDLPGAIIEVGIFQGGTLLQIGCASRSWGKALIGYDTFAGLPKPDVIDRHKQGEFLYADKEAIAEMFSLNGLKVELVEGLFPDSANLTPSSVSFCHLDVDLYAGTRASLDYLSSRMALGGLIVLDDYKWPSCPGVEVAVAEFLTSDPSMAIHDSNELHFQITLKKVGNP